MELHKSNMRSHRKDARHYATQIREYSPERCKVLHKSNKKVVTEKMHNATQIRYEKVDIEKMHSATQNQI